jgi:hypothetical protein
VNTGRGLNEDSVLYEQFLLGEPHTPLGFASRHDVAQPPIAPRKQQNYQTMASCSYAVAVQPHKDAAIVGCVSHPPGALTQQLLENAQQLAAAKLGGKGTEYTPLDMAFKNAAPFRAGDLPDTTCNTCSSVPVNPTVVLLAPPSSIKSPRGVELQELREQLADVQGLNKAMEERNKAMEERNKALEERNKFLEQQYNQLQRVCMRITAGDSRRKLLGRQLQPSDK